VFANISHLNPQPVLEARSSSELQTGIVEILRGHMVYRYCRICTCNIYDR
jgi:hypothetical protein